MSNQRVDVSKVQTMLKVYPICFIITYFILSFVSGFIKKLDLPLSYVNLIQMDNDKISKKITYDAISVIAGLTLYEVLIIFFLWLTQGMKVKPGLSDKIMSILFIILVLFGTNLLISLTNWLLSIALNIKLSLMSNNKLYIISHQIIVFVTNIISLIVSFYFFKKQQNKQSSGLGETKIAVGDLADVEYRGRNSSRRVPHGESRGRNSSRRVPQTSDNYSSNISSENM